MKFKKLEIYGFKSFADKREIKFSGGVTGIVGPNGCGKSNVADSIRWVLGEQSAKLLRGSTMMDVIFNGTETRKSMSFCEVALYFDNTTKMFPSLDYSEVVISRKLYRSGESQYFINGEQSRLKDINELLMDGGMGRDGYSIIGQGRIDELLSSKPEDRRAIFEEAAGVAKFKQRRKEASRKLERTEENMLRLNDIMVEKEKQLAPLAKQAETAHKYLELRDNLRFNEINSYIYQYDSASDAKAAIRLRLNGVLEEMSQRQREFDALGEEYRESMSRFESIDREIETLREQFVVLNVGIAEKTGALNVAKQELGYLTENLHQLENDRIRLDATNVDNAAQLERHHTARLQLEREYNELKGKYDAVNAQFLAVVDEITAQADEVEKSRREELEAVDKLTEIKSNMSRLTAERDNLREKISLQDNELNELYYKRDILTTATEEKKVVIDDLETKKQAAAEELTSLQARNNALLCELNGVAAEIDKVSNELYTLKGQYRLLKDMKDSHDAYNNSIKNLVHDAKADARLGQKVEGIVAELLIVRSGFETAIEMALGGAYQNVVTKNEEDAAYIIEHLKRTRRGRITCLPISIAKPREIDPIFDRDIHGEGCYGNALELVEFDKKYTPIFRSLLGGIAVVDNMDVATRLARKTGYRFMIVTLDGEVYNPRGSITGGSIRGERSISGIFTHERQIKELMSDIDRLSSIFDGKDAHRNELADEQEKIALRVSEIKDAIRKSEEDNSQLILTYNQQSYELTEASKRIIVLEYEHDRDSQRFAAIDKDINSVGELEELIKQRRSNASESNAQISHKFEQLGQRREELRNSVTELMLELNTRSAGLASEDGEIERLAAEVEHGKLRMEENAQAIEAGMVAIKATESKIDGIMKLSGDDENEKVVRLRAKMTELDELKKSLSIRIAEIDGEKTKFIDILNSLSERKNAEEFKIHKVDSDIDTMQQRVQDEYGLSYEQCLQYKANDFDLAASYGEINKLKRSISALGNINIDAIEQSKTVSEEYQALKAQMDDLTIAQSDLNKIIKELSSTMLKQFSTQFEQIRTNFVKIFKELFDGGNADLVLLDSEDPLEAGIEIIAQPPQKKLQSISLLSGGERALTAIAILFAILRLKPMPFCVLDEIEAALDDANAFRFAQYLRRFSEETQFIVITHRKPTMELADNLYGVTMEEKGISKVVSVKLSEAVAQAEKAKEIGA